MIWATADLHFNHARIIERAAAQPFTGSDHHI
jgi:calcineurin-like phosphoesterase family protein